MDSEALLRGPTGASSSSSAMRQPAQQGETSLGPSYRTVVSERSEMRGDVLGLSQRSLSGRLAVGLGGEDAERLVSDLQKKNEMIALLQKENARLSGHRPESTDTDSALNVLEMQERNAQLLIRLRSAEEVNAELRGRVAHFESLPPKVEVVNLVKPEIRTVTVENSEHIEKLRDMIQQQQDENLRLRENLRLSAGQAPQVEVVVRKQYVEVPKVELRYVEVENVDKLNLLITRVKDQELEIRRLEGLVSEWQAKCARLEQNPPKVEVRTVEVESTARIQQLIDELNEAHGTMAQLRQRLITLEHSPATKVEYVDKNVYIEVPEVEVQRIEVENTEKIQYLQRVLEMKDQELDRARNELTHLRESQRRLEAQIAVVLRSNVNAPGAQQSWRSTRVEKLIMPRVPVQVYTPDDSDPADLLLAERLKTLSCRVPFKRANIGKYHFGSLLVHIQVQLEGQQGEGEILCQLAMSSDGTASTESLLTAGPVSLAAFLQQYEEREFSKLVSDYSLTSLFDQNKLVGEYDADPMNSGRQRSPLLSGRNPQTQSHRSLHQQSIPHSAPVLSSYPHHAPGRSMLGTSQSSRELRQHQHMYSQSSLGNLRDSHGGGGVLAALTGAQPSPGAYGDFSGVPRSRLFRPAAPLGSPSLSSSSPARSPLASSRAPVHVTFDSTFEQAGFLNRVTGYNDERED